MAGRLTPEVLPVNELKLVLAHIQHNLPTHMSLPFPLENVWEYYATIRTTTVLMGDSLVVTMKIPLVDPWAKLTLYEVINIPVPARESSNVVRYHLEFTYFGITADGRRYAQVTGEDLVRCEDIYAKNCVLTSPLYEINRHQYCVMALFRAEAKKVDTLCQRENVVDEHLPIARYVEHGSWVVSTKDDVSFRVDCQNGTQRTARARFPFSMITLGNGCRANSDRLS